MGIKQTWKNVTHKKQKRSTSEEVKDLERKQEERERIVEETEKKLKGN